MGNSIVRCGLILLVATSLAACGGNEKTIAQSAFTTPLDAADRNLSSGGFGEAEVLRIREDALRKRTWVLTLDDVRVYDSATRRLVRRIALPVWSVARDICMPDMALDESGSALIAANAHPVIWQIHADSFELKEREITLQGRESWAMGFGALAFAADGRLFALTSIANSLWIVDVAGAKAKLVTLYEPPLAECALPTPSIDG